MTFNWKLFEWLSFYS